MNVVNPKIMRLVFFLFFLLHIPGYSGAVTALPAYADAPSMYAGHKTAAKSGFFERIAKKIIKNRLKKAIARSGDSDGKWLAIAGLASGLLGALSFVFFSYTGFFLPLALGLAGLLLSIFGLIKAGSWQDTRLIRILAVTGIVISALVAIPALVLIGK